MDRKNYGEIKQPLKAIRTFCVEECCCGNYNFAKTCVDNKCPLFAFRLGKNPYRKQRTLSDEQKKDLSERLSKGRAVRAKL